MSAIDTSPGLDFPPGVTAAIPAAKTVIAAVIEWRGRIALLRRSSRLGHEGGLWHCVTGFLEPGATPEQQALEELFEETGVQAKDLLDLRPGPALVITDSIGGPWLVHTFTAVTSRRRLTINWEHDRYRWTPAPKVKRFSNRVAWLDSVLHATGHLAPAMPAPAGLQLQDRENSG
ncbi:NUDIX domain-containing protein [Sinomonas sp.]|jgi:8-oxo-dGTP pyrophosphatase MutT (NUDIX family)|uniref:NUDIX domain-containing protein n=1 Tax=Sinomonas sp. TaxID=1914986 RepID=UPI002FE1AAF1